MIGKLCWSTFPYYDRNSGRNAFKKRPVLILSGPRNNDYTVLPVSSISIRKNIDTDYDIEVDPNIYPRLHLTKTCYIRTHKQTIVHQAALTSQISDLKNEYPELYLQILEKLDLFHQKIIDDSL